MKKIALTGASVAKEKKARDILILNLRPLTIIADYFVILSCESEIQIKTVTTAIIEKLSEQGIEVNHIEGTPESKWVLLDYGGLIVHIFHENLRDYYQLEKVWGDAERVDF
ncbi:MAG TPA: ribosome silencing factor [Candidatus Omnitrophica bacterium]|nr:ribosome silencing factor [Candidatus Omnitrophota bacterium]